MAKCICGTVSGDNEVQGTLTNIGNAFSPIAPTYKLIADGTSWTGCSLDTYGNINIDVGETVCVIATIRHGGGYLGLRNCKLPNETEADPIGNYIDGYF